MTVFNKSKTKLHIFTFLTILWIAVIFSFSLQSGDESSKLSGGIVSWLVSLVFSPDFANVELLETIVRKMAHFTEYTILGVLLSFTTGETKCRKSILIPWLLGVCVACCDETIQLFSDGRAGRIADVILDAAGVFVGVFVCSKIQRIFNK